MIATVRKRASGQTRTVLLEALATGAHARLTSKGIMLYGPNGTVSTHFTGSDHRGAKNLTADLRRAGILPS